MSSVSFLEKLLDGVEVEWTTIGEVFDLKNGYTPSKANTEYWTNGEVPWFRMEDIRTNGRILKAAIQSVSLSAVKGKLIPANSLIMSTTATLGEHALIEVPFLTNQQITSFSISGAFSGKVDIKFMYHYFFEFGKWCSENANKNGGMGIIGIAKLKQFQIPIPCPDNPQKSLEIQAEIVRILDSFTELTAELTARKKQYNYYRDKLLSFDEGDVEWKVLGESAEIFGGLTGKTKSDFETGDAKYVPYRNIFSNIAVDFGAIERVQVFQGERQNAVRYGDVLFTASSETAEEAGMSSVVLKHMEEPVYLNSFAFGVRFHPDVPLLPDFTKHLFRSSAMRSEIVKTASGVTRFNISKERFKKIRVPVPSLAEQAKIAAILDKFDALTNSITEGLPREIELRQKQYEYYRDLLLSFPKPQEVEA